MQKVPLPNTGSPNLLSPNAYYVWYHQHHGLQEKEKSPIAFSNQSKLDRLKRVLKIYEILADRILEDLREQFISDEKSYKQFELSLKSRLDNKLRVDPSGKHYISINGSKFDGSADAYESNFMSGKRSYSKVIKNIAEELKSVIFNSAFVEEDKTFLVDGGQVVEKPQEPESIAVDLDGTILDDSEQPTPGSKEALEQLQKRGYRIVVYTARFSHTPRTEWQSLITHIQSLLKKHSIPFDEISIIKPDCKFFIDNRAISWTNWKDVLNLIDQKVEEDGPQDMKPSRLKSARPGAGAFIPELDIKSSKSFTLLNSKEITETFSEKKD